MRCLHRILSISWTDKVSNNEVLDRADIPSTFTLLRQCRLRWLGHVHRMEDGRIPKDLLYGELESGSRPVGRPKLRFKDVCKRDMLTTGLPAGNWESHAADRGEWRSVCSRALQVGETKLKAEADERRAKRKTAVKKTASAPAASDYICSRCDRICRSRIGLLGSRKEMFVTSALSHGHGPTTAYYYFTLISPYQIFWFSTIFRYSFESIHNSFTLFYLSIHPIFTEYINNHKKILITFVPFTKLLHFN